MKIKQGVLRFLSAFVAAIFLHSSIAWSAPDLCLRQRSILERNISLESKIQKAKEDLARLNIIAEREAQKLENIRARINQNPTNANKEFFGLVAERLMLVLTEMQAIKDWFANQDYSALRRNINWIDYESNIPYPSGPQQDIVTTYKLFPENAIVATSAAAGTGRIKAKKTASVLMAGGAGVRLQELYKMGAERRKKIGAGDLKDEELQNVSKPTVPYSKLMHKSPITIIIESVRRIQQDTSDKDGEDEPLIIITGPDTKGPILSTLRANNYFGIKRIVIRNQGMVPVFNTKGNIKSWGPVESAPGKRFVEAPNGGGGTVTAVAEKGILVVENGVERYIENKGALDWLDENCPHIEDVNFLQTDMALESETILGLAGVRDQKEANVAMMGFDYPAKISVKVKKDDKDKILEIYAQDEFTLGTLFSDAADPNSAAIVEYGERGDTLQNLVYDTRFGIKKNDIQQGLDVLIAKEGGLEQINAKSLDGRDEILARLQTGVNQILANSKPKATSPDFIIPANAGAFNMPKKLVRKIIDQSLLKPHVQPQKDRATADGKEFKADNLELFITDLPQVLGRPCVAGVDEGDALPAKDPVKFVESRNYFAKRHEGRLRTEFGVSNIGADSVIEISPLFRGKIEPSLKIGNKSTLYLGGSYIGQGVEITIGKNVEIADGTTVIIEGNGPVIIEDGVKFGGGTVKIRARQDEQPVTIRKGYVYKDMVLDSEQEEDCRKTFKTLVNEFNAFAAPFNATLDNCTIEPGGAGNLNPTFFLTNNETGERFVIQQMGQIFDVGAIDHNLQLLEIAQAKARQEDILPEYWQDVSFLSPKGAAVQPFHDIEGKEWRTSGKIYHDPATGKNWRVMKFVEGEFVNAYSEILQKFPGASMAEAAKAHGEAIAIFGAMLGSIQPDIDAGNLPAWEEPLTSFHNTRYHGAYLIDAVYAGRTVALSLKRGADLSEISAEDPVAVYIDYNLIDNTYSFANVVPYLKSQGEKDRLSGLNPRDRVAMLVDEFEKRRYLETQLDETGKGIAHNDTKINNFPFQEVEGKPRPTCLIDLDTIQVGRLLDDLGDLLRSASNIAGEEPPDINDVRIDIDVIQNVAEGYLATISELHGQERADHLRKYIYTALKVYCYELGSRFFADSLVGNKYFRFDQTRPTYRPDLNLFRGEVQMRALQELEKIEAAQAATNPLGKTGQAALRQNQQNVVQAAEAI